MRRFRGLLLCALAAIGLSISFQNCGQGFNAVNSDGSGVFASSLPGALPVKLSVSPVPSANLGTSLDVPIAITPTNFTGPVDLEIDSTALDAYDTNGTLDLYFDDSRVVLTENAVVAHLSIDVPANAPTLNTQVTVKVTQSSPPAGSAPFVATLVIPVVVNAVYQINLEGPAAAKETWSAPSLVQFASHPEGVKIIFMNNSTDAHYIHSAGPIPHASSEIAPGQTYEYTVTSMDPITDTYYCHEHEDPSQAARTLAFNVYSAPPVHMDSGNANAKYSYLAANVFTKCIACHNGGSFAPYDFRTYASIIAASSAIVPGSSASSGMYLQTLSGQMPQGGTKLSSTDEQALKDWIDDGAKNN